jgi:hypothetical protein
MFFSVQKRHVQMLKNSHLLSLYPKTLVLHMRLYN